VGIGASAGGIDAFKRFFSTVPADSGLAFVLVQHLSPTHESLAAAVIGRYTPMPVVQVRGDTPVRADRVYVIPPREVPDDLGRSAPTDGARRSRRHPHVDRSLPAYAGC